MSLPRILVIDDFLGGQRLQGKKNTDRSSFCMQVGAVDGTGDQHSPQVNNPVAELVFCRGQIESNGVVENDLEGTLKVVRKEWMQWPRWALVLLDLHFATGQVGADGKPPGQEADDVPDQYFGLTILEQLHLEFPDLPVVILSTKARGPVSRRFSDLGAMDFLVRTEANRERLKECLDLYGLIEDNRMLKVDQEWLRLRGHSLPMLLALRDARRLARNGKGNILLLGESGSGKELFAHYIHDVSKRPGVFVPLVVHSVPETLIEDELFGHERGAFADAKQPKEGKCEQADGGTLFVDECGDIPPSLQVKFLRLLEPNTREVQRLGSTQSRRLDLQVVLATDQNIDIAEAEGGFRQGFHRRLTGRIVLPPLRERREDLPLLIDRFVQRAVQKHDAVQKDVSPEALEILQKASWPGNVGQLEQVINRAVGDYPHVEYLAPVHLKIEEGKKVVKPVPNNQEVASYHGQGVQDLQSVIQMLDAFSFSGDYAALQGKLREIERAYARFVARYLKTALTCPAIQTFSPSDPNGQFNWAGSVKCITGKPKVSTPQAKDVIKQILQQSKEHQRDPEGMAKILNEDEVLRKAYEEALKTRPKQPHKSRDKKLAEQPLHTGEPENEVE